MQSSESDPAPTSQRPGRPAPAPSDHAWLSRQARAGEPAAAPETSHREAARAMIMSVKKPGANRRMSRLVRWLAGRNALRRPVDRIEGAVLVALSAAFLVAIAVASILGAHTYQSQRAARSACARLRPC